MGFLQDQFKKLMAPVVKDAIDQIQKSDQPKVTEVPTQMTIGYAYTGGARRKPGSLVDFDSLRTFSTVYDVARVCINHRKRQINNLEWAIVPKDDKEKSEKFKKRIDAITAFFEEPAPATDFKTWLDRILEDILVIDAGVVWKDKTFGGELVSLLPVDGATIRLKVEEDGTTPLPPEIAYQQIITGEVYGEWTIDEMYYKIMNPRTSTPYGLSPLECLIIGVDSALRSQMYNSSLLSEGTTPEGFLALPEAWTPDQIKDYQNWFDTLMAGNFNQNSRIKMIPGGRGVGYTATKKPEDMRMLEFEKWLLMKTCAMFDVQPQDIGFVDNVTTTTQDGQQELGNQRGLVPMANYMKAFFTQIIAKDFGSPDLKFEWKGLQVVDTTFELDRAKMMMEHGGMTINEQRISQGMDPIDDPMADKPIIYTASGPILLETLKNELDADVLPKEVVPEDGTAPSAVDNSKDNKDKNEAQNELEEMERWEKKAVNYFKLGKGLPKFKSEFIDKSAMTLIQARLSVAKSRDEIKVAFAPFKEDAQERALISEANAMSEKISGFKRKKYERVGQGA